jgi:NADPH:quinone reductase-like Zn-dependent oxidoreductase
MKAAVYSRYGPPDVVQIKDVDKPVPKGDEVLIRVGAASVNPLDWHFMRGTPYFLRAMTGLRKPKDTRLGVDVAGLVETLGRNVTQFKPGDEVFGSCRGAFAEYVCASPSALVMKPENITFAQAASVPVAGFTALQGLRDKGHLQAGQSVLINGASGGVGTFAVQIAKSMGADVTGVCSTTNMNLIRSLGADRVIDYTREDFTHGGHCYDLILDCIGNHSLLACGRVLNHAGTYVAVGGPTGRWMIGAFARAIAAPVLSRFVSQKFTALLAKSSKEDLAVMHKLMHSGKVTPVIDKDYSLNHLLTLSATWREDTLEER